MKKHYKTAFSILSLALIVLLLLIMIPVAHAHWVESQANEFLAVLQQVQVGSSNEADV